jgi:hypothetical protein
MMKPKPIPNRVNASVVKLSIFEKPMAESHPERNERNGAACQHGGRKRVLKEEKCLAISGFVDKLLQVCQPKLHK